MQERSNRTNGLFDLNGFRVDTSECLIGREGDVRKVTPRTMELLVYLSERSPDVVPLDDLLDTLWAGTVSSPNAVQKCVAELRQALADDPRNPRYVQTIPKRGYKLLLKLESVDPLTADGVHEDGSPRFPAASKRPLAVSAGLLSLVLALFIWLTYTGSSQVWVLSFDGDVVTIEQPADEDLQLVFQRSLEEVAKLPGARLSKSRGELPRMDVSQVQFRDTSDGFRIDILSPEINVPHVDDYTSTDADEARRAAAQLAVDLETLLDDEHRKRMALWGTTDPHAYRFAHTGDIQFQRFGHANLERARQSYVKAIESDQYFAKAYQALYLVYQELAYAPGSDEQRERMKSAARDLVDRASATGLDDEVVQSLRRSLSVLENVRPSELEAVVSQTIREKGNNWPALIRYGKLLTGAGYFAEAQEYLNRGFALIPDPAIRAREELFHLTTLHASRRDLDKVIPMQKEIVRRYPEMIVTLFGLVQNLAAVDDISEAERYLARLKVADTTGRWAHTARVLIDVITGKLQAGTPELEKALSGPLATNRGRAQVYFTAGDVEKGIAAWRNMEPAFQHLSWEHQMGLERIFHPAVVAHPKYQAMLDDHGIGLRWRMELGRRADKLAEITQIAVTTPLPASPLSLVERASINNTRMN